jgi:hypothetical protein
MHIAPSEQHLWHICLLATRLGIILGPSLARKLVGERPWLVLNCSERVKNKEKRKSLSFHLKHCVQISKLSLSQYPHRFILIFRLD